MAGREIAPNTSANATKFFTMTTKCWNQSPNWKNAANFLVKFVSKTRAAHLGRYLDAILYLGELERCISSILVSTL